MRRRPGVLVLAVLALALAPALADPAGTCSNPDSGGAKKPCSGGGSGNAGASLEPVPVKALTPKALKAALEDAPGVSLLLVHKGDK